MLLLIDNYDSFTHNLARYFIELGQNVKVIRNNKIDCQGIKDLAPDYLVLSPGPCTPNQAGVTLAAISEFAGHIPILGVCLGHQAIGQVFGASVVNAAQIKHGKTSKVSHSHSPLFQQVNDDFLATRYHSLVLQKESIPDCFDITAWCEAKDKIEVMAIEHKTLPIYGVQFHPESLLTQYGHDILDAFLKSAPTSTSNDI